MDIYSEPMYTTAMVSRLTQVSSRRVSAWLRGDTYIRKGKNDNRARRIRVDPILGQKATLKPVGPSFYELIDILYIKAFLNLGHSIQKIRKAVNEAKAVFKVEHLAHRTFFADENNIWIPKNINGKDAVQELSSNGQLALSYIIDIADHIFFNPETGFVETWRPQPGNEAVLIDPKRSFGRPIIFNRNISTEVIYDLYLAERKDIQAVTDWFRLERAEVGAAVNFEQWLNNRAA